METYFLGTAGKKSSQVTTSIHGKGVTTISFFVFLLSVWYILLSFISGLQDMWGFTFMFLLLGLILFTVGVGILSHDKRHSIIKSDKQRVSVERDYAWEATRRAVIKRANNMCERCKARSLLQVHHIKPKFVGGTDSLTNLVLLCSKCHENKLGYKIEKKESDYETEPAPKTPKMELLLNAIKLRKEVEFDYIDSKRKKALRTILPDEVYHGHKNRIYVKAHCSKHKRESNFRISRMKNLKLK